MRVARDMEVINIEDYADEMGEDDMADPERNKSTDVGEKDDTGKLCIQWHL